MKQIASFALLGIFSVFLIASGSAQSPPVKDEQKLLDLVKEVQSQQVRIADNQTKIDTKLAEVAEAVRVARIFAGRGGH